MAIVMTFAACSKKEKSKKEQTTKEPSTKEPSTETKPADAGATTPSMAPTATVKVSDADALDVWVHGEGTPVILVHGGFFGDLLKPLADELGKKGSYQLILYHRRGHNGKPTGPVTIPEQATDIVKVLDQLKIEKAHLVGHSYGANVSLQAAMQSPDRFLSVVLLEPMLVTQIESAAKMAEMAAPVFAKAQSGDLEGASADFVAPLGGSKEVMETAVPGSWARMVETGAQTWFTVEAPALMGWKVAPADAGAIKVPLALVAADKGPIPQESRALLKKWAPGLKLIDMPPPAADHFFPVKAPAETAAAVDTWIKSQKP